MSVWDYTTKTGKRRYRAKFFHENAPHEKKGFKTKAQAMQWEVKERKRAENPEPQKTLLISFGSLATKYLEHCKARMQKNTWRAKSRYYASLIAHLGTNPSAESVSKITLLEFLQGVKDAEGPKNANRHLKDVKALYVWGCLNDLIHLNPAKTIQPFPEEKIIKYVPPAEDIDSVLLAADQEEMDLLICLYHTGGRIGEILRLTWEDVNLEKRSVTLWTRKRRGGQLEEDQLAMSGKLFDVLSRRWGYRNKESQFVFCREDGSPYTYDGKPRKLMERLCARASVKPFGFHAIRHHVASIIADSGKATLGQIQKFLRHRRQSTTENYLHQLTRDQREVADLLDASQEKSQGKGGEGGFSEGHSGSQGGKNKDLSA